MICGFSGFLISSERLAARRWCLHVWLSYCIVLVVRLAGKKIYNSWLKEAKLAAKKQYNRWLRGKKTERKTMLQKKKIELHALRNINRLTKAHFSFCLSING